MGDFKTELSTSDMFDPRLKEKILKIVDVSYGGENGFNQAIELCAEVLSNVKFVQEKKLICHYFEEISKDTGRYCFGVVDTLQALELGAAETVIVWENLDIMRYNVKNTVTNEERVLHLNGEQQKDPNNFKEEKTGAELEVIENITLVEWLANNYKRFGANLEFITNRSQEGSQFCKGFGGIGALLRYRVDFASTYEDDENEEDFI